jgi:hypothetical protein
MQIDGWKGEPGLKENDLRVGGTQKSSKNDPGIGTKLGEIHRAESETGRGS